MAISASVSARRTFAGTPITSEPGGTTVSSVTTAPAAMMEFSPICAVEDDAPHAHDDVVPHVRPVHNRPVSHGHTRADRTGRSGIGVQHGPILDVAAAADADRVRIAAQHGTEPDAGRPLPALHPLPPPRPGQ